MIHVHKNGVREHNGTKLQGDERNGQHSKYYIKGLQMKECIAPVREECSETERVDPESIEKEDARKPDLFADQMLHHIFSDGSGQKVQLVRGEMLWGLLRRICGVCNYPLCRFFGHIPVLKKVGNHVHRPAEIFLKVVTLQV